MIVPQKRISEFLQRGLSCIKKSVENSVAQRTKPDQVFFRVIVPVTINVVDVNLSRISTFTAELLGVSKADIERGRSLPKLTASALSLFSHSAFSRTKPSHSRWAISELGPAIQTCVKSAFPYGFSSPRCVIAFSRAVHLFRSRLGFKAVFALRALFGDGFSQFICSRLMLAFRAAKFSSPFLMCRQRTRKCPTTKLTHFCKTIFLRLSRAFFRTKFWVFVGVPFKKKAHNIRI